MNLPRYLYWGAGSHLKRDVTLHFTSSFNATLFRKLHRIFISASKVAELSPVDDARHVVARLQKGPLGNPSARVTASQSNREQEPANKIEHGELPIPFSAPMASVASVYAFATDSCLKGFTNRSSHGNVKFERAPQLLFAKNANMESLATRVWRIHKVRLKGPPPLVRTANDEINHA
jgi:hypothetical protein